MEKHGLHKARFYTIWHHMKQRCQNEKRKDFYLYGGRGIRVCDEWKDFINFKNDMYEVYLDHVATYGEKETTLDRINTNGDYESKNCRWATQEQQLKNRRKYQKQTKFIAIDPKGIEYIGEHQKDFAFKHNLISSKINDCLRGRQKQHKGWRFKYLEG